MSACGLDRDFRRIHADHGEPESRELLSEESAPAADVEGPEPRPGDPQAVREDVAEVREPARSKAAVQDVEWIVLVPPARTFAVVDLVIDRHRHRLLDPLRSR